MCIINRITVSSECTVNGFCRYVLSSVCVAGFLAVRADIITDAPVGQLFVYELHREVFQSEFEPFHKVFRMLEIYYTYLQYSEYFKAQFKASVQYNSMFKSKLFSVFHVSCPDL